MEKYLRTRQLLIDFEGGRPVPRLREPLALFSIPSSSCPFQGVRWPVECGAICDKINHIGINFFYTVFVCFGKVVPKVFSSVSK